MALYKYHSCLYIAIFFIYISVVIYIYTRFSLYIFSFLYIYIVFIIYIYHFLYIYKYTIFFIYICSFLYIYHVALTGFRRFQLVNWIDVQFTEKENLKKSYICKMYRSPAKITLVMLSLKLNLFLRCSFFSTKHSEES